MKGFGVVGLIFAEVCGALKSVEENIPLGVGEVFCKGKDGGGIEKSCLLIGVDSCISDSTVLVELVKEKLIFGCRQMNPSLLHSRVRVFFPCLKVKFSTD